MTKYLLCNINSRNAREQIAAPVLSPVRKRGTIVKENAEGKTQRTVGWPSEVLYSRDSAVFVIKS